MASLARERAGLASPAPGDRWTALGVGLGACLLYLTAVPPSIVLEGDCGEFVAAASVGGVPHAPGYPTYMVVASLLGLLAPREDLAFLLNCASALFGAATVALATLLCTRLVGSGIPALPVILRRFAGGFAGLLLGVSTAFWTQSLSAEVYMLSTALMVACLLSVCGDPPGHRSLVAGALFASLALGAHYNVAGPCLILVALSAWRRRHGSSAREWLAVGGAVLLGSSTFLYLPIRSLADPVLDLGDPETPIRFWRVISLAEMPTQPSLVRPLSRLGEQVWALLGLVRDQWAGWLFLPIAAGAVVLARERRLRRTGQQLLLVLVTLYAGILLHADFPGTDGAVYELRFLFLPAYVVLAIAGGLGLAMMSSRLLRKGAGLVAVLLVLVGAGTGAWVRMEYRCQDKSRDDLARAYGRDLLEIPQGRSIVFTRHDNAWMPLTYLQTVEGLRPDVALVAEGLLGNGWYRRMLARTWPWLELPEGAINMAAVAAANVEGAVLYHTSLRDRRLPGFEDVPVGLLTRLDPGEERALPPGIPPAPPPRSHALRDRREWTLLVSYLLGYRRMADWFLQRGFLVQAERALREGLEVPVPDPPLDDFLRVRASLLVKLGALQAAQGRRQLALGSWRAATREARESSASRAETESPSRSSRP